MHAVVLLVVLQRLPSVMYIPRISKVLPYSHASVPTAASQLPNAAMLAYTASILMSFVTLGRCNSGYMSCTKWQLGMLTLECKAIYELSCKHMASVEYAWLLEDICEVLT